MKVFTIAWLFSLFLLFIAWATFAQERKTNLGEVVVRFCNDANAAWWTKTLEISTEPNKEEEICMYLDNSWPTPVIIGVNFVDGTLTADEDAKKACEPEGSNKNFWQYVKIESTGFIIQPKGTLQTKAIAKFPTGVAGRINGCVTYYIIDDQATGADQGMFRILSRRANFIDVFVSWTIVFDVQYRAANNPSFPNIWRSENVGLYMHPISKLYNLKSEITNSWNIPSLSTISWSVSWWFGRVRDTILAKQVKIPAKQDSVYEYELPRWVEYGGPVTVTLHAIDTPELPEWASSTALRPVEREFAVSAFILPRWIIGALAILLGLIAYSLRKWNR